MEASEENRMPEEELIGQMSYVYLVQQHIYCMRD